MIFYAAALQVFELLLGLSDMDMQAEVIAQDIFISFRITKCDTTRLCERAH
jgi:hypothetical protein